MSYQEIIESFAHAYIREYGEKKFREILDKVFSSNKISKMIDLSITKNLPPGSKDILHRLNEIPYFLFSRGQTLALAGLLTLQRWDDEVNFNKQMLSEEGLRERAENIIKECKVLFTI